MGSAAPERCRAKMEGMRRCSPGEAGSSRPLKDTLRFCWRARAFSASGAAALDACVPLSLGSGMGDLGAAAGPAGGLGTELLAAGSRGRPAAAPELAAGCMLSA